jgi:hypothetical protein
MFNELLYLIVVVGPLIVYTHYDAFISEFRNDLWEPFPTWYKNPWFWSRACMLCSFVYITIMYIFVIENTNKQYILLSYILLMTGAVLWAPACLISLHRDIKSNFVLIVVWLTALGSFGLCLNTIIGNEDILMILASVISTLHFVVVDALYWWYTWQKLDRKPLFTMDASESDYNTHLQNSLIHI